MTRQQPDKNEIISLVDQPYRIGPISFIEPIHHGDWNQIYKIWADRTWVLRISHPRKQEKQLRFELDVMTYLRSQLPVIPAIHQTGWGGCYNRYTDRFVTLFEFVSGHPIEKDQNSVQSAGILVGRIHKALADYSRDHRLVNNLSTIDFNWVDNYMFSGDVFQMIKDLKPLTGVDQNLLKDITTDLDYLRAVQERLNQWEKRHTRSGCFTESIIHGDYYSRYILTDDNQTTGVLDWDETITDWLEYEVGNALFDFSRDDTCLDLDQVNKQNF